MTIQIDKEKCTGCKVCIDLCPYPGAIEIIERVAEITGKCTGCGACVDECPEGAIMVERKQEAQETDLESYRGVWVFVEQEKGKAAAVSLELLSEARRLAEELDTYVGAVVIGNNVYHLTREAFAYGADVVYLVENQVLKEYRTDPYNQALVSLIEKYKPEIVLLGATYNGRDLAPRTAASIYTGLTADCTELSINKENNQLEQTRPAFGGNVMATIVCPERRPQMATVRPKVMNMSEPDYDRTGKVIKLDLELKEEDVRTKILEVVSHAGDTVKLEEADIIVAGGKGLGGPEGFKIIKELAEVLGGALGASRGAVDAGWIASYHQIGQTGKTVRPKLYIACGISGAVQHLTGMQSADTIVAINKDHEAPVFSLADYGIVGDLYEVVPFLIEEFKSVLG